LGPDQPSDGKRLGLGVLYRPGGKEVGSWFRGAWNKNPTGKYREVPLRFLPMSRAALGLSRDDQ